ncbi:MAG: hypothetical protein KAW12_01065, partial [Candidatus Aminicenantes bacterium]|nr:hypothetical protein [Candidatus Aminicenantes bacterium]
MGLFDDLLGIPLEAKLRKPLKKLTDKQYETLTGKIIENLESEVTPSQEDSPEAIEHRREKARSDREWAKHYYFPHYCTKPDGDVHRDMHEMMHVGGKSIVAFVMPRDHGKTTHGSFADVILDALLDVCPYQIIIWKNADVGILFLRWVKFELDNNARLRQDYGGELISYSKESEIEVKGRSLIQTLGARQPIRGLKYKHHRPTKVIAEDIDDDETVRNPKRCEKVLQWILAAIYPAIDDNGVFCMIGTAISRYSTISQLINYIKEKAGEFEAEHGHQRLYYRVYPAIIDEGTERERALWPEGKSLSKLKEIRDIVGPIVWAGEFQNKPIDDAIFSPDWDTYYDRGIYIIPDRQWVYGSGTDPSAGASDRNCFKAHVVLAMDMLSRANLYVAEAWIKKTTIPDMNRAFIELFMEYRMQLAVFEVNGYQAFVKEVLDEELFRKGIFMTIKEVTATTDKLLRIQTMVGPYSRGRIQFIKGHSDQDLLRDQFHRAGTSSEIDGPDAMQMIYAEIQRW